MFFENRRVPFDWKNPIGFIIFVALESAGLWVGMCFAACLVTFGIGSYLIEITINKITKTRLNHMNCTAEKQMSQMQLMKQFSEYIEHQSAEKQ